MSRVRRTNCCTSASSTGDSTTLATVTSCPDNADLLTIKRSGTNYLIPYKDFVSCLTLPVSVATTISIAFPEKPYDYAVWAASTIVASETIFKTNIRRSLTVPANFLGWRATLDTAPTSAVVFPLFKVAGTTVTLARVSFAANTKVGTFSSVALTSVPASAQYILKAPANVYSARGLAMTMLHTVRVSGTFTGQGSQSAASVDLTSVGARITSVNNKVLSINSVLSVFDARLDAVSALIQLTSGMSVGTYEARLTSVTNQVSNLSVDSTLDVLALETLLATQNLHIDQTSVELATRLTSVETQLSNVSVDLTLDITALETLVATANTRISQVSALVVIRNFAKLNAAAAGTITNSTGISSVTNNSSGIYTITFTVTQPSAGYYVLPAVNSIPRGIAIDTKTSTTFRVRTYNTSTGGLTNTPFTLIVSR